MIDVSARIFTPVWLLLAMSVILSGCLTDADPLFEEGDQDGGSIEEPVEPIDPIEPIEPIQTGLQSMVSTRGDDRTYFVLLPEDNAPVSATAVSPLADDGPPPLLIAFHGTGGSHTRWTESEIGYDLIDWVGQGAVMVFPNALEPVDKDGVPSGVPQWSFSYDFEFFADLLAELDRRGLEYDANRIFITGHSSGGGMAHEVGCKFGDVVRAVAPSAGSLISTECTGSVAVLMSQGVNDSLVKIDIARSARRFWVLYNGWEEGLTTAGEIEPCVDHSLLGAANTPYPVYWCEHTEGSLEDFSGHRWASFTGEAVWQFFSGLPAVDPTADAPAGGGNERAKIPSDTTITFTLKYPEEINTPLDGAITLYPAEYLDNPGFAIPDIFLNPVFAVGNPAPGDAVTYENVPISFFQPFGGDPVTFPSSWTLSISVYVDGGTRPTPTAGIDHQVQIPITFESRTNPVIIEEELLLVPARCFFNCGD